MHNLFWILQEKILRCSKLSDSGPESETQRPLNSSVNRCGLKLTKDPSYWECLLKLSTSFHEGSYQMPLHPVHAWTLWTAAHNQSGSTRCPAAGAQWIVCHWPVNKRVACSIRSQGTRLVCGPGPQQGARERQPHIDVSLPLFPPPFPFL